MKKLLITGASGLLGQHLCRHYSSSYEVVGVQNSTPVEIANVKIETIDLGEKMQVQDLISKHRPDFIVHTAALTSVDECELKPDLAYRINVLTTKNLVEAIAGTNAKFIYISTDHIFSGLYADSTEETKTEPLNVYAVTKLQGEDEALKLSNSIVLRTNFYGGKSARKPSFSSWIYNELSAKKTISMFTDSHFNPVSICGLTENIGLILKSNLKGIYNFVGAERISKYEFGLKTAEIFNLDKTLIKPALIEDLKLKAPRPKDMSLSIKKIERDLPGYVSESITQGLQKIKEAGLY